MSKSWLLWFFLFITDVGLVSLGYLLALLIWFGSVPSNNFDWYIRQIPYISFCVLVFFWFFEIYSHIWKQCSKTLYYVGIYVFFINVSVITITFLLHGLAFPRVIFPIAGVIQLCLLWIWRRLWQFVLNRSYSES